MRLQHQGGFLIAKIHQLAERIFSRKLRETGIEINPAQGRIMFILWQTDRLPIIELARRTSLGKSTLTSMLDRLEASGYVSRIPCPNDRRTILIERTEKDRTCEKCYAEISRDMSRIFYKDFKKQEIDKFEDFLARIFANLDRYEKGSDT
jgi:DNA-binding MarR family transcriptional regulator